MSVQGVTARPPMYGHSPPLGSRGRPGGLCTALILLTSACVLGFDFVCREFGGADFFGSMTAQPIVLDAYSGFAIAANALAVEIAAMVDTAPTIGLLYSEPSALIDPVHRDLQLATYTRAHFLHGGIQIVPSDALATTPVPAAGGGFRGIDELGVLFVASVSHIADAELSGLRKLWERQRITTPRPRGWSLRATPAPGRNNSFTTSLGMRGTHHRPRCRGRTGCSSSISAATVGPQDRSRLTPCTHRRPGLPRPSRLCAASSRPPLRRSGSLVDPDTEAPQQRYRWRLRHLEFSVDRPRLTGTPRWRWSIC